MCRAAACSPRPTCCDGSVNRQAGEGRWRRTLPRGVAAAICAAVLGVAVLGCRCAGVQRTGVSAALASLRARADDRSLPRSARGQAIFDMFAHHIKVGMTSAEVAAVLGPADWLKRAHVYSGIGSGWVPLTFDAQSVEFAADLFIHEGPGELWRIYFRLSAGLAPCEEADDWTSRISIGNGGLPFLRGTLDVDPEPRIVEFTLCYPDPPEEDTFAKVDRFGTWYLKADQVMDWQGLCSKLIEANSADTATPARRICRRLQEENGVQVLALERGPIAAGARGGNLDEETKDEILYMLNDIMGGQEGLYEEAAFQGVAIPAEARRLLSLQREDLDENGRVKLDRLLLETAFPAEIGHAEVYEFPPRKENAIRGRP